MIQYGVAVLEKGTAILCGLRLVLNHLANSEPVNITFKEYWNIIRKSWTGGDHLNET